MSLGSTCSPKERCHEFEGEPHEVLWIYFFSVNCVKKVLLHRYYNLSTWPHHSSLSFSIASILFFVKFQIKCLGSIILASDVIYKYPYYICHEDTSSSFPLGYIFPFYSQKESLVYEVELTESCPRAKKTFF